mgnify:CR=1 FL=1
MWMYAEKNIKNQTIIYSEYKYESKQHNIEMLLDSQEFSDFLSHLNQSYNIVIWWDGTMLHALKNYNKNGKKYIWINFWNKWFLLQDKKIILQKNNFIEKKYSIFDIQINDSHFDSFINEVSISAKNWKMWAFEIQLWQNESFELHWDWFVVSTPIWSTAYNSSLWGPILSHHSKSLVITPKAPWKPRHFPSIVIPENEKIHIKNIWRFHGLEIHCDGQSKHIDEKNDEITIIKSQVELVFAIAQSQEKKWENKIFEF